jgi:hypothetical protein
MLPILTAIKIKDTATFLNLIPGYADKTQGEIVLDGQIYLRSRQKVVFNINQRRL